MAGAICPRFLLKLRLKLRIKWPIEIDTLFRLGLVSPQMDVSHQSFINKKSPVLSQSARTSLPYLRFPFALCFSLWVIGIAAAPVSLPQIAWSQTGEEVDVERDEGDFDPPEDEEDPAALAELEGDLLDDVAQDDDPEESGDDSIDDALLEDDEVDPDEASDGAAPVSVGTAPRLPDDSPLHFDPNDVSDAPSGAGLDGTSGDPTAGDAMAARLLRTDAAIARGDLDEARSLWQEVPGEAVAKFEVYNRIVPGYMKRGEFLKALEVLLLQKGFVDNPSDDAGVLTDPGLKRAIENDIRLIVKTRLEASGLEAVVTQYSPRFPSDLALLRLATLYDAQGDYAREGEALQRFMTDFPNHPDAADVRARADAIHEKIRAFRYLIGVVLPLRGTMAPFGQAVLDGIRLAVGQFHETHPKVSVGWVVRDVEETEPPFSTWLETHRPVALVGPLLSRDVNRVAPLIAKTDLLLMTPGATASEVTGLGTSVVRNALTTRAQCRAIAGRAAGEMRLKRFAILYPAQRSGPDWMKCFSEEVARQGGEVVVAESYLPGETDFAGPIGRIKEKAFRTTEDGSVALAIDALFLPADSAEAGLIIPQLAFHGVRGVTLLGVNSWNDPEFLKRVGRHAEGALFADGFFLESARPAVQTFVGAYQRRFGRPPDLLAAQGYDATQWILTAIASGADTPKKVASAVAGVKRYDGVSGYVSEIQNGEAIKRPFFIQVKRGRFVQVE